MDQVQANEQLGGAPGQLGDPMQIPDLVVEGAGAQSLSSQQGSSLGGWGWGQTPERTAATPASRKDRDLTVKDVVGQQGVIRHGEGVQPTAIKIKRGLAADVNWLQNATITRSNANQKQLYKSN